MVASWRRPDVPSPSPRCLAGSAPIRRYCQHGLLLVRVYLPLVQPQHRRISDVRPLVLLGGLTNRCLDEWLVCSYRAAVLLHRAPYSCSLYPKQIVQPLPMSPRRLSVVRAAQRHLARHLRALFSVSDPRAPWTCVRSPKQKQCGSVSGEKQQDIAARTQYHHGRVVVGHLLQGMLLTRSSIRPPTSTLDTHIKRGQRERQCCQFQPSFNIRTIQVDNRHQETKETASRPMYRR